MSVKVNGKAIKVELTADLQSTAIATVDNYAKAYKSVADKNQKLSHIILDMGKLCVTQAEGDLTKAAAIFEKMAEHGRKAYQSRDDVKAKWIEENPDWDTEKAAPIEVLLPGWSPTCSEIKRALLAGVDVKETDTIYEAIKERKQKAPSRGRNENGGNKTADTGVTFKSPVLMGAVDRLVKTASTVKDEHTDEAVSMIEALTAELRKMSTVTDAENKETRAGRNKPHKGAQAAAA